MEAKFLTYLNFLCVFIIIKICLQFRNNFIPF